jgi:hypothetical protein
MQFVTDFLHEVGPHHNCLQFIKSVGFFIIFIFLQTEEEGKH